MSVVLLVGAGLLLASFYRLQQVDPGYRSDGVLSAEVYGNFTRYGNIDASRRLYQPILERLTAQPGVVSAAVTNAVPLAGRGPGTTRFEIEGRVTDDPDRRPTTDVRVASDELLRHARHSRCQRPGVHRARHGREPAGGGHQPNDGAVLGGADPLGTRVSLDRGETWLTVVGVVGDVRQFGLAQETVAQVYLPLARRRQLRGPGAWCARPATPSRSPSCARRRPRAWTRTSRSRTSGRWTTCAPRRWRAAAHRHAAERVRRRSRCSSRWRELAG